MQLHAILASPPGLNSTYRSGRGRWYKSARAVAWEQQALLDLRMAGFQTQPCGSYWVSVGLVLHTIALDLDAPLKLVIDTIEGSLGIDDRWIGQLEVAKVFARHRADQHLEIHATIVPVDSKEAFSRLSEQVLTKAALERIS